ncbi:MAG: glycosyltransferase family 2 protein [Alkalinema sp. CAN_BIN05]|nr:glycosyltransferase family 2 protein [Alkalinema sp. CAN_BIN05]
MPVGLLQIPYVEQVDTVMLSLVVPTYNEAGNVVLLVEKLTGLLDRICPNDYELIIVDDNSPDQTWEIARSLLSEYPNLRVMRRTAERGLSTAVIRGWQVSRGRFLGVIDGDLQHPPEVLEKLLGELLSGSDLALASRHVVGGGISEWSVFRRMTSRGAQILGLMIAPQVVGRVSDPMSGYFMVRRSAVTNQILNPQGYKILLEILGRGEIEQISEVGYVFQERQDGESKVTWRQYVEYLQHLVRLRSNGRLEKFQERFPIGRFLKFGAVGFSGVFVDLGVFWMLSNGLGLAAVTATILSAEVAVLNNFIWNDQWTFGDRSIQQPGRRSMVKRFLKFNVLCLVGIVLQGTLVGLMSNVAGVPAIGAKLLAIALVMLWNFWINLKLSWRVTDTK